MGWIERAIGRAIIYQGVREVAYEARRNRRRRSFQTSWQGPAVQLEGCPTDHTRITYECPNGHQGDATFPTEQVNERLLVNMHCATCNSPMRWRYLDQRIEYPGPHGHR